MQDVHNPGKRIITTSYLPANRDWFIWVKVLLRFFQTTIEARKLSLFAHEASRIGAWQLCQACLPPCAQSGRAGGRVRLTEAAREPRGGLPNSVLPLSLLWGCVGWLPFFSPCSIPPSLPSFLPSLLKLGFRDFPPWQRESWWAQ